MTIRCVIASLAHEQIDANAYLNPKDIMRRARQLRSPSHVAAQIKHINFVKVFLQILAHTVERQTLNETVIGNEGNDAFIANSI